MKPERYIKVKPLRAIYRFLKKNLDFISKSFRRAFEVAGVSK